MTRFIEIFACLLVVFGGTVAAIDCYSSVEVTCSGDPLCDEFEDEFEQVPTAVSCPPLSVMCGLSFASVTYQKITITNRIGVCAGDVGEYGSGCYGRSELEEIDPSIEDTLEQMEELLGIRYNEVGICLCDTDLCNGVPRSAISIIAMVASLFVTISTVFG